MLAMLNDYHDLLLFFWSTLVSFSPIRFFLNGYRPPRVFFKMDFCIGCLLNMDMDGLDTDMKKKTDMMNEE